MGKTSVVYLPDGQQQLLPISPRTWVDVGPTTLGDPLRARTLTTDASGSVLWHRQRPLFQGFASLAQSIPTATFTAITGLSELVDNYAGHSDTVNTGRYYVPNTNSSTTGGDWYLVSGYVPFNSPDATTAFTAGLRNTGSATIIECGKVPSGTGHVVDTMAIDLMQMNGTSDYVELIARQVTGAAVNTVVAGKSPSLTVRWVCADPAWSGSVVSPSPAVPHAWTASDIYTGSATGAGKVPLNTELRDYVNFLNYPPIARLTSQGTTQVIPTGGTTWTSLNWTTAGKTVDNYTGWNSGTPSRYTCQRAGLYLVAGLAAVAEPSTNSGYRSVRLLQTFAAGGTQTYAGWATIPQTAGTTGSSIYATALLRMAVGDYVETQLQHTQVGANLTVLAGAGNAARMNVVWMAA